MSWMKGGQTMKIGAPHLPARNHNMDYSNNKKVSLSIFEACLELVFTLLKVCPYQLSSKIFLIDFIYTCKDLL